ncbi:lipopolysaccharide biosynthesis protein [Dellaglioa carnosa]|uniref:lipopolysaccharide biosynthesis protein n=1 Tax=Dellaglioa carnosa TaxID=2995136 RepID=UPI0022A86C36|nr:oligosaccharide flippase family protein [Dellaglioa carnosa]MCZ2492142.1 oligosaccharide flippase family protein [Dellaglioa carnosa]
MNKNSRLKNSAINSVVAGSGQILNILLKFVVQTVFIRQLGAEYLGINGLFVNILSILSFAELGIGTAITFSLYKPLAEGDEKAISAVMNFFKKAYNYIGFFVAFFGLMIIPFLPIFLKNTQIPELSINIIYIMYLANSVASYFFTYKRSLLIADQKGYISVLNQLVFSVFQIVIQIIILFIYKSYIGYLLVQIICTVVSNIFISFKVNKTYKFLSKYKNIKINNQEKNIIKKNTIGMMGSKIGGIVVNGTDNLIISGLVGVIWVGLYSNYFLIVNSVGLVLTQLVTSISASIGNLVVLEKSSIKKEKIYNQHNYVNFILILFSSSLLMTLLNPFIKVWIGEKYLLSTFTVITVVLNYVVAQSRQTSITFITSFGLFSKIGIKSIFEAAFNLIFSLGYVLYLNMGISGVLLGTMTSNILINVWFEPYVVYKYGLKMKLKINYFLKYFGFIFIVILNSGISYYLTKSLAQSITYLFVRAIISIVVSSIIFILFFTKNESYKLIKVRVMKYFQ